jgi:hypothetical protein
MIRKLEMNGKIDYKRNRIMSGRAPHKLLKMEIRKYLIKKDAERAKKILEKAEEAV